MKTNTKNLITALSTLSRIQTSKVSLPILQCVRLETKGNQLVMSASNLDEYQSEMIECSGKLPPMCVSLKKLQYSIGQGEETEFEVEDGFLTIQPSGVSLGILEAGEFPVEKSTKKMEAIGVDLAELAGAIQAVAWARSTENTRYPLQSIQVVGAPKMLAAHGTDGRKLALFEKPIICSDFEILVMGSFADNFCEQLLRAGAVFMRDENNLTVKHDAGTYWCKVPEVSFPDVNAIKPKESLKIGTVDIAELKNAMSIGLAITNGSDMLQSAKFSFGVDGIQINLNAPKQSAKMNRKISGEYAILNVALDMGYVGQALKAFESLGHKTFKILGIDELSVVTLKAGDLTVLIMPVRLN